MSRLPIAEITTSFKFFVTNSIKMEYFHTLVSLIYLGYLFLSSFARCKNTGYIRHYLELFGIL